MTFKDRKIKCKKIQKTDSEGIAQSESFYAIITDEVKTEGGLLQSGDALNEGNLNKGNWRDDNCLSFTVKDNNPFKDTGAVNRTRIYTNATGDTWIEPPTNLGAPRNLNNGNWREDETVSFKAMTNSGVVPTEPGVTKFYTDPAGNTWVNPPIGVARKLNNDNGRDDESVSFKAMASGGVVPAEQGITKFYTDTAGDTWLNPPSDTGKEPFKLGKMGPAFFRMEIRNGDLWLITPSETNPLHIDQNGHLILTV